MQVTALRSPLVHPGDNLFEILSETIDELNESSVVAITSKIVALSEGRVEKVGSVDKHELVKQTADYYTDPHSSKYDLMLAIKHNQLFVNAGIDESNADGHYVLWPENPQVSANSIWEWLRLNYDVEQVGVILTDSKTTPLYWGVTGAAIAHCGFRALSPKIGQDDLFGRPMAMTQVNVAQALAGAAVYQMGETNERTPVAILEHLRDIEFQDRPPTKEELESLRIELEDDVYAPVLSGATWHKGGGL